MKSPNSPFVFKWLEIEEIEECTVLAARIFALFDPFIFRLRINKEELIQTIRSELEHTVNDKLVVIAKDRTDRICGCYAGFLFSKLKLFSKHRFKQRNVIQYGLGKTTLPVDKKLELLDEINYCLLKEFYDKHLSQGELDASIFCDWFCVSEAYFVTSLAKDLALSFFLNASAKGIENMYGSFFTPRAIKLITQLFPAKIVKEVKVVFEDEEKEEYNILLLYGNTKERSEESRTSEIVRCAQSRRRE